MTTAPANLKAVRALLLAHLDIHESGAYPSDLDPAEVGIVGDSNHRGGYHCGSDRVYASDYSVDESPRDRNGLTLAAAAIDIGQFSVKTNGRTYTYRDFAVWLVGECAAGATDTLDIREIIYSPDGETVKRWDRLKRRSTGDSSHLWHNHISYFRDAIKAGRDLTPVYRRWLRAVGLIPGGTLPRPMPTPPKVDPYPLLGKRTLKRGMTGEDVKQLQRALNAKGASPKLSVDGEFGAKTLAAVLAFQRKAKLVADGWVGPKTVAALKK